MERFCYILQNSDIPFLSKESGIRNNSYSVKGIGTQGSKILYSYSFPKSLILFAFTVEWISKKESICHALSKRYLMTTDIFLFDMGKANTENGVNYKFLGEI